MNSVCYKGFVDEIIYRNENGYTVFLLEAEEGIVTCVGSLSFIDIGANVQVKGKLKKHHAYGEQVEVDSLKVLGFNSVDAMHRYLSSRAIKGIGPKLAQRIIDIFGDETEDILTNNPKRLSMVKGISYKKANELVDNFNEKKEQIAYMMFMQNYGISLLVAQKLLKKYGNEAMNVISGNPYKMVEDIKGVGFKSADKIALNMGIDRYSDKRIEAAVVYLLNYVLEEGDTYIIKEELHHSLERLLELEVDDFEGILSELVFTNKVTVLENTETRVYSRKVYNIEREVAQRILDLDVKFNCEKDDLEAELLEIQEKVGIELDDVQINALVETLSRGFCIITGGPGTGKTTVTKCILNYYLSKDMEVLLAAPTGRAAKRMNEATGYPASTIHRLLEVGKNEEGYTSYNRNADCPIEADVIIVDEASMIDIFLMCALLRAVLQGTRIILVGDKNQLPSVGAGNVLSDIIASNKIKAVSLTKIYRQGRDSHIITNAYKILNGEMVEAVSCEDFYFINGRNAEDIISKTVLLLSDRLCKKLNVDMFDLQVLSPTKKGSVGIEALNEALARRLNESNPSKQEIKIFNKIFKEGDKVMQVKNNYSLTWKVVENDIILEEGSGVFNGDIGYIKKIDALYDTVTVVFDDNRLVEYEKTNLDELELAYAVTIHKSQGSEYPAIVLILYGCPRPLMTRNILYTAVTRAKKCVVVLGSKDIFDAMVKSRSMKKRVTSLDEWIEEFSEY